MSRKYKFHEQDELYFVTFAVINWIDLFIRNEYKQVMLDSWKYCIENKGLEVYGWCIMTSHIHMLIGTNKDKLQDIMRDMKRYTSERLKQEIKNHPQESRREWMLNMMKSAGEKNSNNINFQLWRQDNQPIQLKEDKQIHKCLEYIHHNPVTAGIVERAEDYLYSSARDYCGIKGMLKVKFVEALMVLK